MYRQTRGNSRDGNTYKGRNSQYSQNRPQNSQRSEDQGANQSNGNRSYRSDRPSTGRTPYKSYGDRASTGRAPYKSFGDRSSAAGTSTSTGERTPYKSYGDRSSSYSGRSGGRPSYGRSSFGNRSGGGNRFSRNNSGGGRSRFTFAKIDSSKYVKKILAIPESEEIKIENSFDDFNLHEQLRKNVVSKGYTIPTPIQDRAIKHIMDGKDLIGLAATGTGKTGAFLIPLIHSALNNRSEKFLIIAPTRELAIQIHKEFILLVRNTNVYAALCIGGESIHKQRYNLSRRPQFVIATPGRLLDHSRMNNLSFADFKNIVVDEVDVMFDMGFITDVKSIITALPADRRTLFFSATMTPKVESLVNTFLNNPVKVSISSQRASDLVDQDVVKFADKNDKFKKLHELLSTDDFEKVLIFVNTKHGSDDIKKKLIENNITSDSIHGDKRQNERKRAIMNFEQGIVNVLVATDVAARGLDIKDVTHVINYDEPYNYENYIHRIGRTGRAGKTGKALTFVPHN